MSINELMKLLEEAEKTPEYQFEKTVVDITERICEIMQDKGKSRADLARELGKSRAWVTKMLSGDQNMTIKTVIEILWSLGYKFEIKAEPVWGEFTAWNVAGDMIASESVVRIFPCSKLTTGTQAYQDESISETTEAPNVSSIAA